VGRFIQATNVSAYISDMKARTEDRILVRKSLGKRLLESQKRDDIRMEIIR
jgi:hypothetical protein